MKSVLFAVMLILLFVSTVFAQMTAYPNPSPRPAGGNVMGPARADDQVARQATPSADQQAAAGAGSYSFTSFNYPGAADMEAYGINNKEEVAGYYVDVAGRHGFVYSGGGFTIIDHPGATNTQVNGINDSGHAAGWYIGSGSVEGGFVYSGGSYTSIECPGAEFTEPWGINNSGKVAGQWAAPSGPGRGFVYDSGACTSIDYPGADATWATGISNGGKVAGYYTVGLVAHGFIYNNGVFTSIDYPGAAMTFVYGVNDIGQAVGWYYDTSHNSHGFLYSGGSFTTITYPDALITSVYGINDKGQLSGSYFVTMTNFGGFIASPGYSISGTVKRREGTPVEEVTITLSGTSSDSTNTAFDGTYSFSGLKSGSYTLTPSKGKSTFKPKTIHATISSGDLDSQDFTLQTFIISGVIKTKKGEPADGVSIVLSGDSSDTTQTASDGTYSFSDLENGHYTVTPTPNLDWYYINPPFKNVLLNDRDVKNVNFTGKTPHNISGRILQGTTPVVGATLTVTNSATKQTAQATTDSEGNYEFDALLDGSYVVAPSMAGFAFKPASGKVKLQDSDVADVDFSAILLHSISGTVTIGGAPLAGATITLGGKSRATTTTGPDGSYSFANLLGGTYTVTPKLSGYTFTPAKITVKITNMDVSGQNFVGKHI